MRGTIITLLAAGLLLSCGGKGGGDEDASPDTTPDTTPDSSDATPEPVPDGEVECTEDEHCDDSDPCTTDTCHPDDNICEYVPYDGDGDGFPAPEVDGTDCGGTDCDDSRDDIFPGAPGVCADGIDQDCDTVADDPAVAVEPVTVASDDGGTHAASLAWSGSEFAIAYTTPASPDLFLARILPDGTASGVEQQLTTSGLVTNVYTDIAWWASEYAVMWRESTSGVVYDVLLALVGSDGTLREGPLTVDSVMNQSGSLAVEDASSMGVTWNYFSGPRWRRVTHSPFALEGTGPLAVDSVSSMGSATSVFTGSEYGVAWDIASSASEVWFRRVGETTPGTFSALGTSEQVTMSDVAASSPSVVWTGSEYGVVWQDTHWDYSSPDIFLARVSSAGTKVLDARVTDEGGSQNPVVGWTGSEYFVAWYAGDPSEVKFANVSADAWAIGESMTLHSDSSPAVDPPGYMDMAWNGSYFGLTWVSRNTPHSTQFGGIGPCDN